jgi:Tol biopolymer transport system component
MLTARRAFDGEEITDVLARVIQSEPEWSALPASTPRALTTLLQRCLRKDPTRRLHSIADARIDLEEIAAGAPEQVQETTAPTRRSWWMPALTGAALGAALTAVASLTMMSPWSQPAAARVLRYTVPMPDGWEMLRAPGSGRLSFDVSPDGEKLLVVLVSKEGTRRVFVRRLDEVAFRELTGTDGAQAVYWAPDSQRFGFLTPSGMRRSDLSGASSQSMVTLPGFSGASWGSRDQIIAATGVGRPIFRWSAAGGSAEPIGVTSKDIVALAAPSWLPDDRGYLYVAAGGPGHGALMVQAPEREAQSIGEFEVPGTGQLSAHYRSGHLLVAASDPTARSVLTAQPFDLTTLRTTGEPAVLLTDLNSAFSASETGVLVYGEGQFAGERFVWLDHQGNALATVTERIRPFNFDLSPDERFMVIQQTSPGLLLHDLTRGVTTNIGQQGSDPIWSPDGKQIAFVVSGGEERGIHVMPAFGGPSKVLYAANETTYLDDWSRDGQWLAGHVGAGGPGILIPLSPGATPIVFEDKSNSPSVDETRFSPDGRWLAYGLNSSGSGDVFLTAVPPTGERWKISVAGGAQPRWRVDGKALYFLSLSGTMMLVDIQATPGRPPEISAPRALFETGLQVQVGIDQFAVNKDGTRFLVRRPDEATDASLNQLHVIVNWPGLLKSETGRSR